MDVIVKIFSVVFVSSFKFLAGPTLAFAYDFNFIESILLTVFGGMMGVIIISYYTPKMIYLWNWMTVLWNEIISPKKKHNAFSKPEVDIHGNVKVHYVYIPAKNEKVKKVFSSRSRRFVKIWQKWGLIGLAFITPVTITIPVGTFIATRFAPNKKKVLLYMFLSVLFWSVLLTSAFEIYQIISLSQLEALFL